MDRNRWAALALLATTIAAVWLAVVRTNPGPSEERARKRDQEAKALRSKGQSEYATIKVMPFAELQSVEEARELLGAMAFPAAAPPGAGSKDELLAAVAEFVYYRYGQGDVGVYKQWRRASGYQFQALGVMKDVFSMDLNYEEVLHEPMPEDRGTEFVFDRLWAAALDAPQRSTRPVAMAAAGKGLTTAYGELTLETQAEPRPLAGEMSADLWRGGGGGGSPNWWIAPVPRVQLLREYKTIVYAEVGIVLEFAEGARHPVVLTYLWDPSWRRWRLEFYVQYNTAFDDMLFVVF